MFMYNNLIVFVYFVCNNVDLRFICLLSHSVMALCFGLLTE